jgi:hypothetical protein
MIEPKSRGVLDTRLRGYDDRVWSGVMHALTTRTLGSLTPRLRDLCKSDGQAGL